MGIGLGGQVLNDLLKGLLILAMDIFYQAMTNLVTYKYDQNFAIILTTS